MPRVNAMPPAPTNNVFRVRAGGLLEGQLTMNTFYYADDKPVGTASLAELVDLFNALHLAGSLFSIYTAAVSQDWSWGTVGVDCPTSPTLATYVQQLIGAGTGPTPHAPNQVAGTISKRTNWKGQHGQSRISIPAVPIVWTSGTALFDMTSYTPLADMMKLQMTGESGSTYTPGLLSRSTTGTPRYGWAALSDVVVRRILGTCRRRKPGVGK